MYRSTDLAGVRCLPEGRAPRRRPAAWSVGRQEECNGRPSCPHPARSARPRVAGGKPLVLYEPARQEGGDPPTDTHAVQGERKPTPQPGRKGGIGVHRVCIASSCVKPIPCGRTPAWYLAPPVRI